MLTYGKYNLGNLANFVYICITGGKYYLVDSLGYSFLTDNTKLTKENGKLRKAIFSIVYNKTLQVY